MQPLDFLTMLEHCWEERETFCVSAHRLELKVSPALLHICHFKHQEIHTKTLPLPASRTLTLSYETCAKQNGFALMSSLLFYIIFLLSCVVFRDGVEGSSKLYILKSVSGYLLSVWSFASLCGTVKSCENCAFEIPPYLQWVVRNFFVCSEQNCQSGFNHFSV